MSTGQPAAPVDMPGTTRRDLLARLAAVQGAVNDARLPPGLHAASVRHRAQTALRILAAQIETTATERAS